MSHLQKIMLNKYNNIFINSSRTLKRLYVYRNVLSYGVNCWSGLDLSRQLTYCMNSPAQVFFIFLKKFKAQFVMAFPSLIHALGSFNSVLHNTNS